MLDSVRNWDFKIHATLVAYCSLLDSSLDSFGPCAEQRKRPDDAEDSVYEGSPIDVRFPSSGIADVGIIWDTSIYSFRDTYYLKQVRQVAFKSYVPSSHPPFYHCRYVQAGRARLQIVNFYRVYLKFAQEGGVISKSKSTSTKFRDLTHHPVVGHRSSHE